jgi:hypothetical protein
LQITRKTITRNKNSKKVLLNNRKRNLLGQKECKKRKGPKNIETYLTDNILLGNSNRPCQEGNKTDRENNIL